MKKQLQPLPKYITNEIRYILEGVKSGELHHVQDSYHCGTAHCVAGWHSVFRLKKRGYTYDDDTSNFKNVYGEIKRECKYENEWKIAKKDWQLSDNEASILFSSNATLEIQMVFLEYLEAGFRIADGGCIDYWFYLNGQLKVVMLDDQTSKIIGSTTQPFLIYLSKKLEKLTSQV